MNSKLTKERIEWLHYAATGLAANGTEMAMSPQDVIALTECCLAAMESEPVAYLTERNPGVEGYGPARRIVDAKQYNPLSEEYWSAGAREKHSVTPLYRHAQQPVVPEEMNFSAACNFVQINGMAKEDRVTLAMRVWNACRAAILQAQSDDDGEPTDDERIMAIEGIHNCERCGDEGWVMGEMGITRCACGQAGNSPVIPDGYVMVPMRLTAENGAKGVLSGEFSETKFVNCPECFGDDECETCDGSGRIEIKVPVSWTTIKDIWIKGIEHFAAAPQEVQVVPEKIEQSRKRVDRCDVCTEGARGGCGTCIFNGNFE
ncbi:hypothetical protein ACPEGE_29060 [Klebsiella sp. K792]|uniref:hypothetical protein n=1 Tax=Klebsiella sp. K792 TaxID=3369401 RepID=UPI003C2CEA42